MIKTKQNNNKLIKARKEKNDEFYTQLVDIEKELKYYHSHFKDKIVYCNCDNPEHSNFVNYFLNNFEILGLKKLIISCYKANEKGIYSEYYEGQKLNDKELNGDGDFRSEECIEILKQADIIVTNPPFSLFREYFNQLVKYDKKFLILGNRNASIYKEVFPLIRDNNVWLGASIHSGGREFEVPNNNYGISNKENKYIKVVGVRWFTNLDYKERHNIKDLILTKKYNPEDYPIYDNYDAINVNKTKDIPIDYNDVMGVPISFFDKYNPKQFKIIGSNIGVNQDPNKIYGRSSALNGKQTFIRVFIKKIKR